ncbi:GNAT family N-acetyltransferase [uncultured Planktosalinus sp.]|uniref:GNAT family N-acetyltransferase n=1 Tax=uncultured Planktosalinus sp. TaxID=1810935 RepID=UPI0030D783F5
MNFKLKKYSQLTIQELYDILQLRSEVFVVEQNCVYQDIDGKDEKALHLFAYKNGTLVAYARLFGPGDYFEKASIGRVIIKENQRKFGYGHQLMKAANDAVEVNFNTSKIHLSAQQYLVNFYNAHGYQEVGEGYLEDGIPHIGMEKI